MSRRSWIHVSTDPVNHSGFVAGYGARDLIVACGGRPIWARRRRAWATSERTALDVIALAEADGHAVSYERLKRDRP